MNRATPEELEAFRRHAETLRAEFRASAEVTARWDREHPTDVDAILDWIDQLRAAFGDPPVDRRPWRGEDFRL